MEVLEKTFWYDTTKITFFWNQAKEYEEEFYYLVFELLYSKASKDESEKTKLTKFIKDLSIPSDITGEQTNFDYEWLKTQFEKINKWKTWIKQGDSQAKWKEFESFLKNFFNSIYWFEIVSIKQASDEQIDLVIKNNVDRPFWINLGTSLIIWEAKNRTKTTGTDVFAVLKSKVLEHRNFSNLWIVFAINGFSSEVEENMKRDWALWVIMVAITWDDISSMLTNKENPIDWLERKITDSFV